LFALLELPSVIRRARRREQWRLRRLGRGLLRRRFLWESCFSDGHAAIVADAYSFSDFGVTVSAGLAHRSPNLFVLVERFALFAFQYRGHGPGHGACAIPRFGRGSASYPGSVAVGAVRFARVATSARHQPFALRVELLVAGGDSRVVLPFEFGAAVVGFPEIHLSPFDLHFSFLFLGKCPMSVG